MHRPRFPRISRNLSLTWCALSIPILVALISTWNRRFFASGDLAIMQSDLMHARWSIPPVGVYSRYDFHHPGPALYVAFSPFWNLFGTRGLLVATAAINCAAIGAILAVLRRIGGTHLLVIGAILVGWFEFGTLSDFINPWNPWVALLPFLLSIVLGWAAWCRVWWALPSLILVVSAAIQIHVGYFLAGVFLVAFGAFGAWRDRAALPGRRVVRFSLLSFASMWVAPTIEQFWNWPGNYSKIVRAFTSPAEPSAGAATAMRSIRQAIAMPPTWITTAQVDLRANPIAPTAWTAVPFVTIMVVGVILAFRRHDRRCLAGFGVTLGSLPVALVAVSNIVGSASPYLIRWVWMIAIGAWIVGLWSCMQSLSRPIERILRSPQARRGVLAASAILGVLMVSLPATARALHAELPVEVGSEAIDDTIDDLAAGLNREDLITFRLEGQGLVRAGAGIIAALDDQGFDVRWPNEYRIHVGSDQIIGKQAHDVLVVVSSDALKIQQRIDAGQFPVARRTSTNGLPMAIWIQDAQNAIDTPGSD